MFVLDMLIATIADLNTQFKHTIDGVHEVGLFKIFILQQCSDVGCLCVAHQRSQVGFKKRAELLIRDHKQQCILPEVIALGYLKIHIHDTVRCITRTHCTKTHHVMVVVMMRAVVCCTHCMTKESSQHKPCSQRM